MTTSELTKEQQNKELNQETESGEKSSVSVFSPATAIYENENEAVFILDMPGVDEAGLEVSVDRDLLIIEGKTSAKTPDRKKAFYTEFNIGNFKRKFKIPRAIDVDQAKAVIKNGRVKLTVPYAKEAVKKIKVQTA